jgi:hypothetical protein
VSPTKTRSLALTLGTLALAISSCGTELAQDRAPAARTAAAERHAERRAAPAAYVVAITIDGFNPSSLRRIGAKRAAGFDRMIRYGASTLNARTAHEQTETMPDHSSVFTGRAILRAPAHRVTFNNDDARTDIHTVAGEYVASMFDVVHDRGRRTFFFAGKDKFAFWNRSWSSTRGAPDTTGKDDGRDKITRYRYGTTAQITSDLLSSLRTSPAALTYLHVPLPDKAGHADGFMSEPYLDAVAESGRIVGRVLDTIKASDRLRGRTTVVLTADHGGGARTRLHNDPTLLRNYRVPFLVWGAGVKAGANLYALNPRRADPGTGRPGYATRQPIRNLDLASLATTLLGYPAVPGAVEGTTPLKVS